MGKTDSGKAGEVGKCRESMSTQQKESGKMGSGILYCTPFVKKDLSWNYEQNHLAIQMTSYV